MKNFTFHNPTKILFGKGQIANLAQQIPKGAKVLITYGGGSIKRNGVYDQVMAALEGFEVEQFAGIEPNPTLETLLGAVQMVEDKNIDFLLAVGGGSVIDGTKFIAAAAQFEGDDPWDILAKGAELKSAMPFGSVLTLPATGSEMNMGSVITKRATQDKLPFLNPLVYPKFSVLDPTTTYSLPVKQIANGVVDAFVHVTEQYLTYPMQAAIQDRFAEGVMLTLIEQGPKALERPEDYDVRANIMWAATLALNGLIGAGVPHDWATHMIGHELTALHGLDHAQTLAIVLPATLQIARDKKRAKLLQYAERVWDLREGDEDGRIDQAIDKTRQFFEALGVKTRLGAYGVKESDLDPLVERLKAHGMVKLGEHQAITPEVSRTILQRCL